MRWAGAVDTKGTAQVEVDAPVLPTHDEVDDIPWEDMKEGGHDPQEIAEIKAHRKGDIDKLKNEGNDARVAH